MTVPSWMWLFVLVFVVHAIFAFFMSPPEAVANWFLGKFELHPKLSPETSNVTIDGKSLADDDKGLVIDEFNQAIFIERYYGGLPRYSGTPVVIDAKQGKRDVRFFLYACSDRVDIFKQYKKKVTAYYVLSKNLQEQAKLRQSS